MRRIPDNIQNAMNLIAFKGEPEFQVMALARITEFVQAYYQGEKEDSEYEDYSKIIPDTVRKNIESVYDMLGELLDK